MVDILGVLSEEEASGVLAETPCSIDFPYVIEQYYSMRISTLRIVSAIVLVSLALALSGISEPASAASLANTHASCCDQCNGPEGQNPYPSSAPDCPLFLCLSLNVVSPFMHFNVSESIYISPFIEELHSKTPVKPIFHPPVIV